MAIGPNVLHCCKRKGLWHKMADENVAAENPDKVRNLLARFKIKDEAVEDLRNRERPTRSEFLILHYSDFKTHWDWIVLTLTYYTAVVVPFVAAFHIINRDVTWIVIDTLVDVFFLGDVIVNFYTTRAGSEGEIVTDLKEIRWKYVKSWFLFDVMTCVPYDAFALLAHDMENNTRLLGSLKALRLFRLCRIARDLDRYLAHTYASLIVLMSLILLLCHWMACGWYNVALLDASAYTKSSQTKFAPPSHNRTITLEDPTKNLILPNHEILKGSNDLFFEASLLSFDDSVHKKREVRGNFTLEVDNKTEREWPKLDSPPKNWLVRLGEQANAEFYWDTDADELRGGPPLSKTYPACLYFTMTAVISQGFGNIYGETHNEQIYCIFILLLGCLLYALILANVTTAIENISTSEAQLHDTMTAIRNFCRLYEVPKRLHDSMLDYVYFSWTATHGISDKKVLDWLPEHMRLDTSVYLHRHVMTRQPAFKTLSETSTRHIASKMERIHIAPGDMLLDRGEEIKHIYFVVSGSLEIIQSGQVVGLVGTRDSFGAEFWRPSKTKRAYPVSENTVQALTYVDLEIIQGTDVIESMKLYSDIQRTFFRNFQLTFDLTRQMSFETVQAVRWVKKVNEDPKIAEKDRRFKKWMKKIRNKKSKVAPESRDPDKRPDPKTKNTIDLNAPSEIPSTQKPEAESCRASATVTTNNNKTKKRVKKRDIVKLIPLSMPIEEYYKTPPDLTPRGGGFRSEVIVSATIYEVAVLDDGTTSVNRHPDIEFSLERLDWMNMELPTETKEILLAILNMKIKRTSRIEALNERLDGCEKRLTAIGEIVERLYG